MPGLVQTVRIVLSAPSSWRTKSSKRGLGSILMNRLGQFAATQGIKMFIGTVHMTNTAMLRFIKRAGLPFEKSIIEPGIWEVRVQLGG